MALFSRKNLKRCNPFGLTEEDLKGDLEGFPIGLVVRMMEEQELQGNEPDVSVFQRSAGNDKLEFGFDWADSINGGLFWVNVINLHNFKLFFEKYPEYQKYNL